MKREISVLLSVFINFFIDIIQVYLRHKILLIFSKIIIIQSDHF